MSAFEWNKIIASVLTAMIVAMAAGILASELVRPKPLEKAVFLPAGADRAAARQRRSEAWGAAHQGVRRVPHLQQGWCEQGRPESLGRHRGGDCGGPELSVFCCVAVGQGSKMGPGKTEPVAL